MTNRKIIEDILKTLDDMGVALADLGHQWSEELRSQYETSVRQLERLANESDGARLTK